LKNACRCLFENLKGRHHLEFLGADGMIILEWILRKLGGNLWTGFIWFRIGTSGGRGTCERANEYSGSIKSGELLD
jgi:hypothetical protein